MRQEQQSLQTSILDRLIDREPEVPSESVQNRSLSISQIKASVKRDLENLLNSRRILIEPPQSYRELIDSVYTYGLRDFTSKNPKSPSLKQQLRYELEKTISQFESRLKNVSIHFEEHSPDRQSLKFRISALMVVEPIKEPVTFDTICDVNKQSYSVTA
ncbi:type VI secretion system baseplate subunit TssE [Candidatus Brocadia pituitae]|nr:type VI secretion system baseplate subunit TssE [Candidatus Brocadia pituitae]